MSDQRITASGWGVWESNGIWMWNAYNDRVNMGGMAVNKAHAEALALEAVAKLRAAYSQPRILETPQPPGESQTPKPSA